MIEELEFKSDKELGKVPENTEAVIQVRAEKNRALGDFRTGEGAYGPWISIPFEIVEGQYKGTYASLMMTVDPNDRRFRKVFELATGIDVSEGHKATMSDFVDGIVNGRFKGVLSPDKNDPRYTRVVRLIERVADDRVDSPSGSGNGATDGGEVLSAEDDVHEDDVPF